VPTYVYTVQPPPQVVEEPFVLASDDDLQPGTIAPGRHDWRIVRVVELPGDTRWLDGGDDQDLVVRRLLETELVVQITDDAQRRDPNNIEQSELDELSEEVRASEETLERLEGRDDPVSRAMRDETLERQRGVRRRIKEIANRIRKKRPGA
jgi:hypothetical protein